MTETNLEFSFKGNRNYVHGTDIYIKIIETLNSLGYDDWSYFELNIKNIAHYNMSCFITDKRQKLIGETVCFNFIKDEKQFYGSLVENTDAIIKSSYSFNENDITKSCFINYENKNIVYTKLDNSFTTIEVIISCAKYYLENAISNSVKWFYHTTKLYQPIENLNFSKLRMEEIFQKRGMVGFNIYLDNEFVGGAYGASLK